MIGIPIARIFGIEIRVQLGWAIVLALLSVVSWVVRVAIQYYGG